LRNLFDKPKFEPDEIVEEKWSADFSRQTHARFDIKSESSYDANLRKNLFYSGHSLVLALKRTGCMAWVEIPERRYRDLHITGSIRIDAKGGYGAGGMLFRMVDEKTYYSFLISNRGYFRLDAVRNGMPFPLVGWTEIPLFTGQSLAPDKPVDFSIIANGSHIVVFARGRWAAEASDSSISEGTIGFTAVSYEPSSTVGNVPPKKADALSCASEVFLESLTIDSRIYEVSELYEKWRVSSDIDAGARFRLAETFVAINQHSAAMSQLRKAWDTPGHRKSQKELLFAGRLAQSLGRVAEAEGHIKQCLQADAESPEGKEAVMEMAKILHAGERYGELKECCAEALKTKTDDPVLWTFQGHAHWNLKNYKEAAAAYDRAFELDEQSGILAKNAANVYDVMGRKKEALKRYLKAGRAFLKTGNYNDLGVLVPILLSLGGQNQEARSLAGKWAFAVEDWVMADKEFKRAEELRSAMKPKPKRDGAQAFLEALILIRAGRRRDALPLLKEAVFLEKDYALFHFRLAETLFLLEDNPDDPPMLTAMDAALSLLQKEEPDSEVSAKKENEGLDGWVNNFAAQVALRKGNLDAAAAYLEKAVGVLGDLPAVRVNRAVLFFLRGSLDNALELLEGSKRDDPEGIMANCAGNLLVRAGRLEEADKKYRQALSASPDNVEYLCNRSSCLIELNLYGEADDLLARAHTIAPGPALLEMISFVAVKKGEYPRAEQACRAALEIDPCHAPSLISLGWVLLTLSRHGELGEIIERLDKLELAEDAAKGREELRVRLDDLFHRNIVCASCDHSWRVPKDPPPAPVLRLFAMPPDNLPAGSCLGCGKIYCVGCAKENIDADGRFICPECNRSLKLVNEGLKKIIHDWAAEDGLVKGKKKKNSAKTAPAEPQSDTAPAEPAPPPAPSAEPEKRGRGRPRKAEPPQEPSLESPVKRGRGRPPKAEQAKEPPLEAPVKRGRGRPPKSEPPQEPSLESPIKRGRGRPPKEPPLEAPIKRGRGRPPKAQLPQEPLLESLLKRGRGRPPKAEPPVKSPIKRGRGRPRKESS